MTLSAKNGWMCIESTASLQTALNAHQMCFKCNHIIQVIHSFILARQESLSVYLVLPHCPLSVMAISSGSGTTHVVCCVGHFLLVFIQSGLGYSGEGWIASERFVYLY